MKQFFTISLLPLTVMFATATTAADDNANTGSTAPACCDEQQHRVALQQLPDPSEFKDDICWVAPEWRDD